MNTRTVNLDRLNSMTKYPSILTYHALGKGGKLTEELLVPFPTDAQIIGTEKIDGTNGRIIFMPDDYYILGSREDLLYASGDLIENPQLGIVSTLKPIAERYRKAACGPPNAVWVVFLEVYGGKTTANAKQYTSQQQLGARMLDVAIIYDYQSILELPKDKIAIWRDHDGQQFIHEEQLQDFSLKSQTPLAPRIPITKPPIGLTETYEWLQTSIQVSQAVLDIAKGKPEGLVIRTPDRQYIAKIRFEDYERTMR